MKLFGFYITRNDWRGIAENAAIAKWHKQAGVEANKHHSKNQPRNKGQFSKKQNEHISYARLRQASGIKAFDLCNHIKTNERKAS
jgi:hypothetical protein